MSNNVLFSKKIMVGTCQLPWEQKRSKILLRVSVENKRVSHEHAFYPDKPALKVGDKIITISFCGDIDNFAWGQCVAELREVINNPLMDFVLSPDLAKKGINKEDLLFLVEGWEKYHLNDMRRGVYEQEEAVRSLESKGIDCSDYRVVCEKLKELGLHEVRGYKFGHMWYCEPVFEDFNDPRIQRLKSIMNAAA